MRHTEDYFPTHDGLRLFWQRWQPDDPAKAALIIVHGVAEHSGRYGNLVEGLLPKGYALYAYDQRGHGRSPGRRGFIRSWEEYRSDLRAFIRLVQGCEPGCPSFLFGHSMGALVVLDYLLSARDDLRGAIVSGVPLDSSQAASPALIAMARFMSRVWPTFTLKSRLNPSHLSCDSRVVQAYVDDPLVFKTMTARWGTEFLDTQSRVVARAGEIDIPLLLVHGEADQICLVDGVRRFYEDVASSDKDLIIYPGRYHETHNEPGHIREIEDIASWIEAHLPEN